MNTEKRWENSRTITREPFNTYKNILFKCSNASENKNNNNRNIDNSKEIRLCRQEGLKYKKGWRINKWCYNNWEDRWFKQIENFQR